MTSPDTEFVSILGPGAGGTEAPQRVSSQSLPEMLPVLGLADIVIFPGMVAPLLVDTQESIQLIDDVVEGDRLLALVLQKKPDVPNPQPADLWPCGCAARILKMLKFPDQTVRVLVEGLWRVELGAFEVLTPYLKARFSILKDIADESIEIQALFRNAQQQFQDVCKLSPSMPEQVKVASINVERPGPLTDLIAPNLNLNLVERQQLIAMNDVKERLKTLLPLLNRELEVLNLSSKIQSDVAGTLSKSQRDYFLREQLRAIQKELGESDPLTTELQSLRDAAEKNNLPEEPKKVALKEIDRLQQLPPSSPEYAVTRHYVDWILSLPWSKTTEDKLDLEAAAKLLDEQHYGLRKVKDRLLEFLAVLKLSKTLKGPILCLVGPPGVGKTSLGRSVADALGRKFERIALGGMRDEAEIRGHRRTYVGALPGRLIHVLKRSGSRNPVILLDEIDKVGSDFRGDPAAALLEVLDPAQNSTFTDHYLDLPFDLSSVLFITTANWLDPIHPALRDRLEVIELPGYTEMEKLEIARRHLLPRLLTEHGLNPKLVKVPNAALRKLIGEYTREAGVRQLEREIASVLRKAARRIVNDVERNGTLIITAALVGEFLGPSRIQSDKAEPITEVGIATGLAWTPVGGEVLLIEATKMPGTGKLILTGSLGDVMKESAQTALSYLRSQARKLSLDLTGFDRQDLHIHVPAGAVPKDGPSAGITLAVALSSLLMQKPVRSDVAMTGEISLRGRVLRIGGLKEKLLVAARYGMKQVIVPEQNRNDMSDVPEEVRKKLKIHYVRHISDVLTLALRDK